MRQLCVCQPTRKPPTTRPAAIHARVLMGTIGTQLQGLFVKGIPRLPVRLAWPPCPDVQIPCSLSITQRREPVRVCPEQESSKPCGQHVIMLQRRPHLARRGVHVPYAAERMGIIPAGPVIQNAGNTAAAFELPKPCSRSGRARRAAHQLAAMLEPAFLKPYGEQHYPRLGSVHGVWKNAQCTVNRLQRVIHTTLPPLNTLARFPPHRATAAAPASASSVAIICPPCGLISTICAAAASDTPAAIAATRLTNGRLVCAVRYETR